jgi:acyl-CoA synthetase (AMP-forming)/AMP-acid ligase II
MVVAADEVGQVEIRGESVVDHYWRPADAKAPADREVAAGPAQAGVTAGRAEAGARAEAGVAEGEVPATRDGWLATGDLGRMDGDGFLYLVGRVDDVINRGGEKVFPRDVEEVLLRDHEVTAAAVVGRPHPRVGYEPVAFVLARPGADHDALVQRLTARCEEQLSRFRRPAAITIADSLPAGPTGKIRHAQLRRELAAISQARSSQATRRPQ